MAKSWAFHKSKALAEHMIYGTATDECKAVMKGLLAWNDYVVDGSIGGYEERPKSQEASQSVEKALAAVLECPDGRRTCSVAH